MLKGLGLGTMVLALALASKVQALALALALTLALRDEALALALRFWPCQLMSATGNFSRANVCLSIVGLSSTKLITTIASCVI